MKKSKFIIIMIILAIFLCACTKTENTSEEVSGYMFIDDNGNSVNVTSFDRVIVCTGSLAETWSLAGGGLIAVTEDAFEEEREGIFDGLINLGSYTALSAETLISLDPDLIILSSNISTHLDLYNVLSDAQIPVAYFSVETFEDYLNMLEILTDITGRKDLYEEYGLSIKDDIENIIKECEDKESPTVLFLRAFSTGVKAKGSDSMTGHMLEDLGAINIVELVPSILDTLSMEEIIRQDPEYIFITTMGSSEEAAIKSVEDELMSNPAWNELSAVKNGNVIFLDKKLFHLKPNYRWSESYEVLANYLYEK